MFKQSCIGCVCATGIWDARLGGESVSQHGGLGASRRGYSRIQLFLLFLLFSGIVWAHLQGGPENIKQPDFLTS